MEQRQAQVALWALLFILQAFLAVLLTFLLIGQSRVEPAEVRSFDLSKAYSNRLTEKSPLSFDDQRKLLALSQDYEKTIASHLAFEASLLNEMRGFYWQLLLFVGITIIVQIILATIHLRGRPPSRAGP